MNKAEQKPANSASMRLDKWLWAARFFKTRSLAKQAIEQKRVSSQGQNLKPSREICVGTRLEIHRGHEVMELDVIALSPQRRGASEAVLLYCESDHSVARRAHQAEQHRLAKIAGVDIQHSEGRPNKKQRRQIHRFRERQDHDFER